MTDSYERSQLSVTMYPEDQLLQLGIPDATGHLQTVEFRHTEVGGFILNFFWITLFNFPLSSLMNHGTKL